MDVVGLVPCAGRGSRLGLPFSKEMFPDVHKENYRPIIMYTIEAMKLAGIEHVIFTINPTKTDLLSYLGNGHQFGMHFSYCVHPEPKSLPESVNEAYHLLADKRVAFAMPDTVVNPQDFLAQLMMAHADWQPEVEVTLGCFPTSCPHKFGMVEMVDQYVVRIDDKPPASNLKYTWGAMVWNPSFTEEIHHFVTTAQPSVSGAELILSDALHRLILERTVRAHYFDTGSYRDLGTYDEIVDWGVVAMG